MIESLTKEEIDFAISKISNLDGINFKYKDENGSNYIFNFVDDQFNVIFNDKRSFLEKRKLNLLIKWNSEITIKVIHLRNTFVYLTTFLNRYKQTNSQKDLQSFGYFAEIISYYFISIRDYILQFININEGILIEYEYQVDFGKLKGKLLNSEVLELLEDFENKIKNFRENVRNGFTHKSNPFNNYYLTTLTSENVLSIDNTKTINNEEFYNDFLNNLEFLSSFIENLRMLIDKKNS